MGYIKNLTKVKCSLSRNRLLCSDTILPQIPGVYRPILQHLPGLRGPLDYQPASIKMEEDWGGQEIASWPHAKPAVGKLMDLAVSAPGEEREGVATAQTLHWSHHSGDLVLSRKEHGDKGLFLGERSLDRSPFGCWKELSNDVRG